MQLLARLERRLPFLTGGVRSLPVRQQTLRATIAWSWELLSATEQVLFRRLAVFAGGFTLEAAEAVCNADGELDVLEGLAGLVDQSLVRQIGAPGEPRFTLLATLQEFALEQLETSGEDGALRRGHATYYCAVAERAEVAWWQSGRMRQDLFRPLDPEQDNLRAALTWALAEQSTARNNARAAMHFLDRSRPDPGQVREALACVVDDADRAGEILDRVRDHIKKAPPRKERVDLNQAITDVIALAQGAIIKNEVSIQTGIAEGLPHVEADRVQVQQVLLNLILNAVEAMTAVKKGARELSISTEQHRAGSVLVAVSDSGPGIDPKHLDRVFDAFYTTKSSGVGMGLSICRSIIDAHGGRLWADANAPRGAVFQFTLPSAGEGTHKFFACSPTREPHEDTVSDAAHQPAYESNKRPHRSGRGRVHRRRGGR